MNAEQARRVGLNEALFREVNERVEALNRTFGTPQTMTVICECADGECTERFTVSVDDYERIRSDGRLFLIVPGHDVPDFEAVVHHEEAFEVVRKREGIPADLADDLDPRS